MKRKQLVTRLFSLLTVLGMVCIQPFGLSQVLAQSSGPDKNNSRAGIVPFTAGDSLWSNQFGLGVSDTVFAIAQDGSYVYVGGDFLSAGGTAAAHVARFSLATHQWSALGSGVNNRVEALAVYGNHLYVGGNFNNAGGFAVDNIAQYNTSSNTWSPVGASVLIQAGFSPDVQALAVDGSGNLFMGGVFQKVDGVNALNIAEWNGSHWSGLGGGLGPSGKSVDALAVVSGSDLYAAGNFTSPTTGVAHWNGSSWSGLGSGTANSFYQTVSSVVVSGSLVYIGGDFTTVTDSIDRTANHVAAWNIGSGTWSPLGSNGMDASVYAVAVDSLGNLYVGGQFNAASGATARKIASWNGSTWNSVSRTLAGGMDSNVYALLVDGNTLYTGGGFVLADGYSANHVAWWNTSSGGWYDLGNSVNSAVSAVAVNGKDVYVGGSFTSAGGLPASAVADWDSSANRWLTLGGGLAGCTGLICFSTSVNSILVVGNDVYVGGNFTQAGAVGTTGIARWNTVDQQWHALGSGLGCTGFACQTIVLAMVYDKGCIDVGGQFDSAGGVARANLARYCLNTGWTDVTWRDINGTYAITTNGVVSALAYDNSFDILYVGGGFTAPTQYAFSTDGFGVYNMGDPLNGQLTSIALTATDVYIGGYFQNVAGNPAISHIAKLSANNAHWLALGNGLSDTVTALAIQSGDLVAGGVFTQSGALGLNYVAKWNGSTWSSLGSGADQVVYAVAADNNFVYAGGNFQNAGGKLATNFDRWGQYQIDLPMIIR